MSHVTEIPGRPTVVLVHGAFADSSSWNGVIERLQAKGVAVTAPANPLRGLASDSALPGQRPRPDTRSRRAGRPLVRRRRDLRRGASCVERGRARVRRGVRARCGRDPRPGDAHVEGRDPGDGPRGRTSIRPRTARRRPSSSSIRPSSMTCSRRTCRQTRRPSLPRRSGRSPMRPSPTSWVRRPGRTCRPGPSLPRPTRPPAPTSSGRWPQRAGATITELDGSHVIMISQPQAVAEVILEAIAAVASGQPIGAVR